MCDLDYQTIGLAIKINRIKHGFTQTYLAGVLGVTQTHLSNVERGREALSLKLLIKVKRIFGCTLDDLVEPAPDERSVSKIKQFKGYKCMRLRD